MLLLGNLSPEYLISVGIVLLFGMGWHEYAHALMANYWGDPTPRNAGRLTPNPLVHINWIGWLMFVVIGFGILGSVPVNPNKMRDVRWGPFWTALAGPLANLVMAVLFGILFRLFVGPSTPGFIQTFLFVGVFYNVLLFFFNLLPFFPMDGWTVVGNLLPTRGVSRKSIPAAIRQNVRPLADFMEQPAIYWHRWSQYSTYVLFGLIILSFALPQLNILGALISQPTITVSFMLMGV